MSVHSAILQKCFDDAASAARRILERALDHAVPALQEAESKGLRMAERHDLADAWRALLQPRPAWLDRYPRDLRLAFQAGLAGVEPAPSQAGRLDALTLVDDAQVVQGIESARLSEQLRALAEQPLAELDGLVSSALGLPAVHPEQNPLRPEIFAQVLRAMLGESAREPHWPTLWGRHMAPVLGRELADLYRRLATRLAQADVHAATYRVLSSPSAPMPLGPADGAPGPQGAAAASPVAAPAMASNDPRMGGGSAWADLSGVALGDELIQDFLFRGGAQTHAPLAPSYYARVASELAALEAAPPEEAPAPDAQAEIEYQQLPAVDRPLRPVSTDTPLTREVWGEYGGARQRSVVRTQLKKQARSVGQVLGLEVVRKLVNQVAQDPRLLAPVRESIVALEPSLLRLAMVDPRFFSDEQHPGRRLVERVAERSFKFNDEFSTGFKDFSASVAAAFNGLNGGEVADAEPFESALATLEASWAAQDASEEGRRAGVMDAVRFAEQRQAQADQIAWDLSQRSDLEDVPAVVQDFLYGPWALVMAHARMTDTRGQIDPGAHGSVVTDLLWSVKRKATLREPGRLIEMIPGLLERLRTGLAALGQTPQECESFFQVLEELHRPVLRLRARKRREDTDSAAMELEPEADLFQPVPRQKPRTGGTPWMGQREMDVAGFQDTLPTNYAELTEQAEAAQVQAAAAATPEQAPAVETGAGESVEPSAAELDQVMAGLREGAWVDLYSRAHWLRAQLIWASTKGTLFMFVSHGGQPHSMTRRSCERLLRQRLLRPVEMHGVVAHAIGTLAQKPQREALAA